MFGMTQDILILIPPFPSISFPGFLTLPTAYVTGNPVECVLHPRLWNTTEIWDPLGVGQMYHDEYEEENIGYQIGTVSPQAEQNSLGISSVLSRNSGIKNTKGKVATCKLTGKVASECQYQLRTHGMAQQDSMMRDSSHHIFPGRG